MMFCAICDYLSRPEEPGGAAWLVSLAVAGKVRLALLHGRLTKSPRIILFQDPRGTPMLER
jgi:hypothetical protein